MTLDDVQPIQILLLEDILFSDFNLDIEDFKQTVMHHRLLEDQIFVNNDDDFFTGLPMMKTKKKRFVSLMSKGQRSRLQMEKAKVKITRLEDKIAT